ncbi:MAG: hypothetical protein J1E37_07595 [Prevotella sp.]|nr:hypothetical protein [Prevotella sp.]
MEVYYLINNNRNATPYERYKLPAQKEDYAICTIIMFFTHFVRLWHPCQPKPVNFNILAWQ